MAAQNFKKEDWGNGDTKLGQNWHKNFQACKITDKYNSGAPNDNIVQNHSNIALLNVF